MRYFILFLFLPFFGSAQTQFWNTSCSTAKFLCENDFGDTLISITQPNCSGGFDVYYYYRTETTFTNANILEFMTTSASGYEVYGPFLNLTDACGSLTPGFKIKYSLSNGTSHDISHDIQADKLYVLKIHITGCATSLGLTVKSAYRTGVSNFWKSQACSDCIPGFRPAAGEYIVSAWTKDTDAEEVDTTTTYTEPYLIVTSGGSSATLRPSGEIIDGWQRIQEKVVILNADFDLSFGCEDGNCFFDDVRIFPDDGSMVTYVYDPLTFRLMAELDDNNYAKFYEYDEDGKLIRVKKETERGIMTIQESRENNSKE